MKMESPGSFTGAYYVSSVCDLRDESLYIGRGSHWQPPQKRNAAPVSNAWASVMATPTAYQEFPSAKLER